MSHIEYWNITVHFSFSATYSQWNALLLKQLKPRINFCLGVPNGLLGMYSDKGIIKTKQCCAITLVHYRSALDIHVRVFIQYYFTLLNINVRPIIIFNSEDSDSIR